MSRSDSMATVRRYLNAMIPSSRLWLSNQLIQHGDTSILLHCVAVAYFSLRLALFLRIRIDERSLIRGALLHDYFLYDWHENDPSHRLHGFYHPAAALKNAKEDFTLTDREQDIIQHHMFPLTLPPPQCKEAALVCIVDKCCGLYETIWKHPYPDLRKMLEQASPLNCETNDLRKKGP